MTTIATIIRDAFRQSNLIPINGDVSQEQQGEALRYLNRIVLSVFGNEAGDLLIDFPLGRKNIDTPQTTVFPFSTNRFIVPPNSRLVCNLEEDTEVYLNPNPDDGERIAAVDTSLTPSGNLLYDGQQLLYQGQPLIYDGDFPSLTIKGNGRTIAGQQSAVMAVQGFNTTWFYRADLGDWVVCSPLTSTEDLFPFPTEFDDYFITMLALRLNPAYGTTLDPQSAKTLVRSERQFRARYRITIPVPSELGLLRLPRTADDRFIWTYGWYDYDPTTAFNKGSPY